MTVAAPDQVQLAYVLRHADDLLVNAQRLSEYMTRGPELEEELAIANLTLDNLGAAHALYGHAARLSGDDRTPDDLAFLRSEREFTNCLLVEQPHRDFADVMVRQMFFDAWHIVLWPALTESSDFALAGLAAKAEKEARYHFRHSSGWVVRLGDGTAESAARTQRAVDELWRFTGELTTDDAVDTAAAELGLGVLPSSLAAEWSRRVQDVVVAGRLQIPDDPYQASGGRAGRHTEHLGHLLAEMQFMQRAYPGMEW